MKDIFDIKRYLTENKLGPYSVLRIEEAFGDKNVKQFDDEEEFKRALVAKYPDALDHEKKYTDGPNGPVTKVSYGYTKGIQAIEYGWWDARKNKGYVVMSSKDPSDVVYPQGSSKD